MKNKTKRIIIGSAITVLITIVVVLYFLITAENKLFAEKGITVKATITEKWEIDRKAGGKRDMDYYFKVSFFTEGNNPVKVADTQIADTVSSGADDIINKIFDDVDLSIGDYETAECSVNSDDYYDFNVGDEINIIYLSDNPKRIRVDE